MPDFPNNWRWTTAVDVEVRQLDPLRHVWLDEQPVKQIFLARREALPNVKCFFRLPASLISRSLLPSSTLALPNKNDIATSPLISKARLCPSS